MNRIKATAFLLTLLLVFFTPDISASAAEETAKVTIIHVNDQHGRMGAEPFISQLAKDTEGNVLILDAGDVVHGQTVANLSQGEAMVTLMNTVGYDAMTVGNHEFNYGADRLKELSEMMDFPLLAANIKKEDGECLFQAYQVFPMDGVTVGVFGLATPKSVTVSDPRFIKGLTFEDPAQTAEAMVKKLQDEKCDVIIALVHMGVDEMDPLAAVAGIDVIISGHSHTLLENGMTIGDTLIAQTGSFGENIGIVEITLKNDKVEKVAKTIPITEETELIKDQVILDKIAEEEAAIEPITSAIVGHTPVLLQGEREIVRTQETNLADLITDGMKYATGADIALLGGGNIRTSIEAGDITMGQILTVLPFSNLLVTVELSGADILEALEHGVSSYPEPVGHYIQISGVKFVFDPEAEPMHRVTGVTMADGSKFDINKTYTVATSEFIAAGGDGYEMVANGQNLIYYGGDIETFLEYLKTDPKLSAEPDGRVKIAGTSDNNFVVFICIFVGLVLIGAILIFLRRRRIRHEHSAETGTHIDHTDID